MPRLFKAPHPDLMRRKPFREAGESALRGGPAAVPGTRARRETYRPRAGTLRVLLLALLAIPASLWFSDGRDVLLARLGYASVAPLPDPPASLSIDDQALYWAFALYDFDALKRRYQVGGHFAIDGPRARRRMDRLLPHVSPGAISRISGYTSIAYHAVPPPRIRP